jgi:hypothetical protein
MVHVVKCVMALTGVTVNNFMEWISKGLKAFTKLYMYCTPSITLAVGIRINRKLKRLVCINKKERYRCVGKR